MVRRPGPGVAKVGTIPLVQSKLVRLWRSTDYSWREAFESADVMSEGAVKSEASGLVYYGTTSVILRLVSHGGVIQDEDAPMALRLLGVDPHARLRAMRIACLEAQLRAGDPLERVATETNVRPDATGLRLDIEVEARVRAARSGSLRAGT